MIFLETDRLILRNAKPSDAEVMFDYRNNEICARYQRGQTRDLEGIRALVEQHRADQLGTRANCLIAVELRETGEMVGEIIVMPNEDCFSLGYTISYRYHRRGYAFEALSPLIARLHALEPEWEFISFTEPENIPSMNLLRKLGYEDLGYAPKVESQVFGKWIKENVL